MAILRVVEKLSPKGDEEIEDENVESLQALFDTCTYLCDCEAQNFFLVSTPAILARKPWNVWDTSWMIARPKLSARER